VHVAHRSSSAFVCVTVFVAALVGTAPVAAQRAFREYPSFEGGVAEAPLPPDYLVPGELVIGHLMFPDGRFGFGNQWKHAARAGPTTIRRATAR
jgi:hypothetical protein